jgi:hypothetical protein
MQTLGLHPYIRRFKCEAGCTLIGPEKLAHSNIIDVSFDDMPAKTNVVADHWRAGREHLAKAAGALLVEPFRELAKALAEVGWREKARKYTVTSNSGIQSHLFSLSTDEHAPTTEQ